MQEGVGIKVVTIEMRSPLLLSEIRTRNFLIMVVSLVEYDCFSESVRIAQEVLACSLNGI